MANNTTTHVIRGTLHWAKVLGAPRMNTYSEELEWSVDLTPNAAGRKELQRLGISDKLKQPKDNDSRKESFLSFRQKAFRTDPVTGDKIANDPITVKDITGEEWSQKKLLGNGTVADVKFRLKDYGKGKKKGVYIQAIRVLSHEPYETEEFAPLSEDDEFFAGGRDDEPQELDGEVQDAPVSDDDMDDDVPF